MMTKAESIESLQAVKRSLIKSYNEISGVADLMETKLTTEYDQAMSKEYGSVCRTLGILEEQITEIGNQITKINK
ncbi:MAG: hypothetical protein ACI4BC_04475 [Muribaculaceae bacterium]